MNYVRIDESQVSPLNVFYFLYPFYEGEEEPDYDDQLLFSQPFKSYDDASEFAMQALKTPEILVLNWNYKYPEIMHINTEYLKRLKNLSEVEIFQELLIFNDKWELVDCPEDYMKFVGKVLKDDFKEEKPNPEKIYS